MSKSPVIRVIDCHVCREHAQGRREYLILRRAEGKIYAGDWRMIGGKIEPQMSLQGLMPETAWQAALRELREEAQLTPLRLYAAPYVNHFYEPSHDRINAVPVFVAVVSSDAEPILDNEHTEYQWVSKDAAIAALPWPAQQEGLRAADQLLASDTSLQTHLQIEI